MDHLETWPVKREDWPGRGGSPDACMYCKQTVGSDHAPDCVKRERTVVLAVTVHMVARVPQSWSEEQIVFKFNESSYCLDNLIDDMVERKKNTDDCACSLIKCAFVGEATQEDEDQWPTA